MPLTPDIPMISVDDHLIEPPSVWQDRLPAKFRDRGPRIEILDSDLSVKSSMVQGMEWHLEAGVEVWRFEDLIVPHMPGTTTIGTDSVLDEKPVNYSRMRPGAYDPVARLADMDLDGVWAEMPFPSFPGFCGNKFLDAQDKELSLLCVRAYNDYLLDVWCATAPDRYIGMVILPLWDKQECVAEIHRTAAKGARAITFPDNPAALGLDTYQSCGWDSVLSAAEEAGLPLCMHFGSSRITPWTAPDAALAVNNTLFGMTLFNSMCEMVFAPTFHRHPKLKVVLAEAGIGWVPYAMQRMDQVWENYRTYDPPGPKINPDVRPSDLVRKHVWSCFIDDPLGVELRHEIGVGRLLWETDYPHQDSLFPDSRGVARKVFQQVPTDEVRRIVCDNAAELFNFPLPQS